MGWIDLASLRGPVGPTGAQGAQGPKGDQGPVGPPGPIDTQAETDLAGHIALKRGVHGIPALVALNDALAGDGAGGFKAITPELAAMKGIAGGYAGLGASDGVVPAGQLAKPGIYVPPGFGQWWRPKRTAAAAGTALARIALLGDSVARSFFASNLNATGWAALVAASLKSTYGDGGSGFRGVSDTTEGWTAAGVPGGAQANYASQKVPTTGAWTIAANWGPGSYKLYSTTSGNTITFVVTGTSVTLFYEKQASGFATFNWTIDGVPQTPVNGIGTPGTYSTTVSGLANAAHTVVVTAGPGGGYTSIYGCMGSNATGVRFDNYARFGAASGNFVGAGNYNDVALWSGGPNNPADIALVSFGGNDLGASFTADQYGSYMQLILSQLRSGVNPTIDILIIMDHVGSYDAAATPYWANYTAKARMLAETYGAALIDFWTLGRNSWAYWNSLNYWSDASGTGASGTDPIHPGNTGHNYMANQILPLLTT